MSRPGQSGKGDVPDREGPSSPLLMFSLLLNLIFKGYDVYHVYDLKIYSTRNIFKQELSLKKIIRS